MDIVQQGRQALDLVHDDPVSCRNIRQNSPEEPGIGQMVLVRGLPQQVDPPGLGEVRLRPGGLPDPTHTE